MAVAPARRPPQPRDSLQTPPAPAAATPRTPCRSPVPQAATASTSQRAAAEVQQQFKELTLSPAQREGKEPVFEGRVTGGCCSHGAVAGRVGAREPRVAA